jgi:dihydropteroate synthase
VQHFAIRDRIIGLDQPCIMGILNVTPDSFSDGGRFFDADTAVEHALTMAEQGADIIDVGGMSSRPGSEEVPLEEERRRVIPVVERLVDRLDVPVSVDTYRSELAREALECGAHVINDITALGDPVMADVVAEARAGLVLMHMQGTPRTMQQDPHYEDVVEDIGGFLKARAEQARAAGVRANAIALDPGIGFGKTVEHNLEILRRLTEFADLGCPVLIGTSRKSFIGKVLGAAVDDRLIGSVAGVVVARMHGASIFRVHDVVATRQALALTDAILGDRRPEPAGAPAE